MNRDSGSGWWAIARAYACFVARTYSSPSSSLFAQRLGALSHRERRISHRLAALWPCSHRPGSSGARWRL